MRLRDLLQRTGLTQDEVELYFGSLSILILGMIVVMAKITSPCRGSRINPLLWRRCKI